MKKLFAVVGIIFAALAAFATPVVSIPWYWNNEINISSGFVPLHIVY